MAQAGGSQCGYCTPGFVMSLFAEQYRPGRSTPCDPDAMAGNLCRCTGYRPIRDAAASLGPPPAGEFRDRLSRPTPRLESVETEGFSRPASIDDCLAILARDPSAKLIAGGTDLGVESNLKFRRWPHLVSVEAIDELRDFTETADAVRIGAALPLTDLGLLWRAAPQAVREWLDLFASPTICNRATLGGNLATASPIGDGAPVLLALDAVLHIAGPKGRRVEPLATFFKGYRHTALGSDELLTSIEIPKPLPHFLRFYKVAKRRIDDISTVAAGFSMDWDASGRVTRARFAFGGVAAVPLRVNAAEEAVIGDRLTDATVRRIQTILEDALHPLTDHRGSAEYRLAIAQSLIEKFQWQLRETAA